MLVERVQTAERPTNTDAITPLGKAKMVVGDYVAQTGVFPTSIANLTGLEITISGKYVSSISVASFAGALGTLQAEFKGVGVSPDLAGRTVHFQRIAKGQWECLLGGPLPVSAKYLPRDCR